MSNKKDLTTVLKQIEKDYGKEAIMNLENGKYAQVESISSGSFILDRALGVGGYPKGRIVEIYGPESSGKTTLALHAIAEVQKTGGNVAFIDAEHALNVNYAKNIGVDIKSLLLSQPDSGEQAMEIADALISSNAIDIVIIDSVAALTPRVEIDGEIGDHTIGAQARLMSKALRKLSGSIRKSNCIVIFINQIREKIGIIFGNPETTPGGRALKFYASLRLEIRSGEKLKDENEFIGQVIKCKVVKNKVASPYKNCQIKIMFNKGINRDDELITLASDYGIIEKSGTWYSYDEKKIGQGKNQVINYLLDNPKLYENIKKQLEIEMKKIKDS